MTNNLYNNLLHLLKESILKEAGLPDTEVDSTEDNDAVDWNTVSEIPKDIMLNDNDINLVNNDIITKINCKFNTDELDIINCSNLTEINSPITVFKLTVSNCNKLQRFLNEIGANDRRITISNCPNLTGLPTFVWKSDWFPIHELFIENTPIEELHGLIGGKDLIWVSNLKLVNTKLTSFPNMYVNRFKSLVIDNTPITELPSDLKCNKLKLSNVQISKLPEGLIVKNELDITGLGLLELPQSLKSCRCIKGFIGNKPKYPDFHFDSDNPFDEDDI